jgi:hypothetical protein
MDWKELTATDQDRARRMAMRALRVYFAEKRWSRLAMGIILLLTGAAGVAASWGLLHAGIGQMWLRYPLSVLIAWSAFLILLWLWIQVERRYFTADEEVAALLKGRDPAEAMRRLKDDDSSVLDWFSDVPDFDDGEGCFVLVIGVGFVCLIFFAAAAILNVLIGAPILFAEVFVDAVLVGALYKRIKPMHDQSWVLGAVRHTWRPVALTAAALLVSALIFHYFAPEAHSAGDVLAHFQNRPESRKPSLLEPVEKAK